MRVYRCEGGFLVRLDRGEDICGGILQFCAKEGIKGAVIFGIGAVCDPVVGFYDTECGEYKKVELKGEYEMLSLMGNVSLKEGELSCHLHIVLGDGEARVYGGHLFSGVISVTGEIWIRPVGLELCRVNKGGGLWLLR